MKQNHKRIVGLAAVFFFFALVAAHIRVGAQDAIVAPGAAQSRSDLYPSRKGARALEGSWSVNVTLRVCATGDAIRSFPAMNTFSQGGTMQEFSVGNAPLSRGPGHGVWNHVSENQFTYAFQLFRFNADGSYGGYTVARREVEMDALSNSYTATATIAIYSPAGTLVGSGCATETAVRFE